MSSLIKNITKCTVIALSLLYGIGTAFAQPQPARSEKPKAAVYIMGNPEGRDALRMAVNNFLIKSGMYQMIAVDAIDVVAREHRRQLSGSVSDGDIAQLGRDAGARYVCVVERTEIGGFSYVAARMVSVQSKVAELADMAELPHGETIINIIERLIYSMLGISYKEEQHETVSKSNYNKPSSPSYSDYGSYEVGSKSGSARATVATESRPQDAESEAENVRRMNMAMKKGEDDRSPWHWGFSMNLIGLPVMLNVVDTFSVATGVKFLSLGTECFNQKFEYMSFGFKIDPIFGLAFPDYNKFKEYYPDLTFDKDDISISAFIHGGAFVKVYPTRFLYLSGGIDYALFSGHKVDVTDGDNFSTSKKNMVVYPIGLGLVVKEPGTEENGGLFFEVIYNTAKLKNGPGRYWVFNLGFIGREIW